MLLNQFGNEKGISIIEILVVTAILVMVFTTIFGLINFSFASASIIRQTTQANALAEETMEAVRNFRDQTTWSNDGLDALALNTAYYPQKTANSWILVAGKELIGIFEREVVLEQVYRDSNDDIAAVGVIDSETKKATVSVSWEERDRAHQIILVSYFTNWKQ